MSSLTTDQDTKEQQYPRENYNARNSTENTTSMPKQPSKFVRAMRRVYRPLGFSKGYNFPLFIIFAGALLGFSLARLSYLNISGSASSSFKNGASPGEWYNYRTGHYRVGITLHLGAIIPASFLAVWQFVPVIRHKVILFHRINGYIIVLLALIGNAGALMIARKAFGGGLEVQSIVYVQAVLTTTSLALAYYNIKRLQIDQHRAWMLRAWFYFGAIITTRIIMVIAGIIISTVGGYYQVQTCGEIAFGYQEGKSDPADLLSLYPACVNGSQDTPVLVSPKFDGSERLGAALGLSFGMAFWMATLIHALGVEIYLNLTPAEAQRLRMRSWERQMEMGFENPGSAGLVVQKWGDAGAWEPNGSVKV